MFSVAVFTIEYALRVWSCVEIPMLEPHDAVAGAAQIRRPADDGHRPARLRSLVRALVLPHRSADLAGVPPVPAAQAGALFAGLADLGAGAGGRVSRAARRAAHHAGAAAVRLDRHLFPRARRRSRTVFDSIPSAAWWALATLTTVGYGDVVPITPLGKVLGGVVMLLGVGMFALPIAIIATGFSQEANRHQFVVTWSMVARVPLFATMDQCEIAEITKLLYTRNYMPGVPMVRNGDAGDGMYLIASGEAEVDIGARQAAHAEGGRFLRRDGAAGAPPPQARRGRQDAVPGLCAGQPVPGAADPPPSGDPDRIRKVAETRRRDRRRRGQAGRASGTPPRSHARRSRPKTAPSRQRLEPRDWLELACADQRLGRGAFGHGVAQILLDLVDEAAGRQPRLIGADQESEVLGHGAGLDGRHHDLLQSFGEAEQLVIAVELGAVLQGAAPGKDRRSGVGRGGAALLMLAEVARHGAVRRLGQHGLAVRRHQHARHQPERAEALRHRVGLHVAVVILARPHIAARPFQRRRHHVVDQPVLVGEPARFELRLELGLVDLREQVLEAAVIGLEDRVLGGEIDRHVAVQPVIERGPGEVANRVVEIEHAERDTRALELMDLLLDARAVLADEGDGELALARHEKVDRAIDVAIGVAADDDRLGPARHQPGHVLADDRLAEDHPAEDVADRAVRRPPHLLEAELLHPHLVRRDGGAFHPDAAVPDGVRGIDGHLIVGRVAILDAEIELEQGQLEMGLDQLVLDHLPDNAGHLVAIEVGDRVLHLDFVHAASLRVKGPGREGADWASSWPPPPLRQAAPYSIVRP